MNPLARAVLLTGAGGEQVVGRCIKQLSNKSWQLLLKRSGVSYRRPYDLRHTYATEALAGGADLRAVAHSMGHADETMLLKVYQRVVNKQRRAIPNCIPDVLPGSADIPCLVPDVLAEQIGDTEKGYKSLQNTPTSVSPAQ